MHQTSEHSSKQRCLRTWNIAMVSDFFYPNMGGVESHIYNLSQCLVSNGHKVIVVTHEYNGRVGVRYLSKLIKVYHLPFGVFHNQCILPTIFLTFHFLRDVFIRENIELVHGHSAFSTLCHDALLHARTLGLKTIFTDHSLFGFADPSSILTNKFLEFSLLDIDHVICVSNTSKENTVLRASLDANKVSVIPNAVDSDLFMPMSSIRTSERVTVVVASRLVYRKGIDLLVSLIPVICSTHNNVDFIIGGDGPKRIVIEEMREKNCLQERVTLVGNLSQNQVRDLLVQGDIFLNTSLTEAFCMAIIEAASCGLQVVSTNVGGIPEVLPSCLIKLAEPDVISLVSVLNEAIAACLTRSQIDPWESHRTVKRMYKWSNVAKRTEAVYANAAKTHPRSLVERFERYSAVAPVAGKIYCFLILLDMAMLFLLDILSPRKLIDRCSDCFQKVHHCRKVRENPKN